jgi:hypothetical protein
MVLRRRIRGKQGQKAPRLKDVVQQGVVPKARRPFALFTAEQYANASANHAKHGDIMRALAAQWRAMPPHEKGVYQERSQEEQAKQRAKTFELGLPIRYRASIKEAAKVNVQVAAGVGLSTPTALARFGEYVVHGQRALGEGSFGK